MITATSSSTVSSSSGVATSASSDISTTDAAAAQDRFLTLLVAQLNNQDPMDPMDNAEVTSQMAQLSAVTGIEQVNATLKSMTDQFNTMQVLQGSSMAGHNVLLESNVLTPVDGVAVGAIDLAGKADSVTVQVMSSSGQVLETIDAGANDAGRLYFNWDASSYQGTGNASFQVNASLKGQPVATTSLAQDKVVSVGMDNGSMTVQLQNRAAVAYGSVKAIL